jgi:endonuclease/exonuclease/phosphatase family metal-dependent hydrolase
MRPGSLVHRAGMRNKDISSVVLVASATALLLSALHVLFPLSYGYADEHGNDAAGVMVVAVFAAPLLLTAVRSFAARRAALFVTVCGLAGWRLAVPFFEPIPLAVAVFGAIAGLSALTLALITARSDVSRRAAAAGLLVGGACDVALRSSFLTWEPAWQQGVAAFVVGASIGAAAVAAAAAALAFSAKQRPEISGDWRTGAGVAIGAVLAVEVLFLMSPGFVSSSAGVSLPVAVAVALAGVGLGLGTLACGDRIPRLGDLGTVTAAGALTVIAYLLPAASGSIVVVLTLAGQVAAAVLLGAATRPGPASSWRPALGFAFGWLTFAVTLLLYQVSFDQPLPFDNRWVATVAAVLSVLAVSRRTLAPPAILKPAAPSPGASRARRAAAVGAIALAGAVAVPSALALTNDYATRPPSPVGQLRIVEWNVRQAVTVEGQLDPEAFAQELERGGRPDVVVLAEVGRGWPVSGDLDLASWLSRRLRLRYVWGGGADGQFGNLVLSRVPMSNTRVIRLPVAGSAQGRSLVRTELELGSGPRLTLLATHLQHQNNPDAIAARRQELEVILREWKGVPRTVLAGDFNPRQGDPPAYPPRQPGQFEEVRTLLDGGFTTTQDLAACTQPTSNRNCSDYIFVTPDLIEDPVTVPDVVLSDHRPVITTIRVP